MHWSWTFACRVWLVRRRLGLVACVVLTALSLIGCTGSGDVEESGGSTSPSPPSSRIGLDEPCPDGVTLGLGAPFRGRDYAKFATTGGTVYVSVGQFPEGTPDPQTRRATIYVGALARPPTYDAQAGRVRGTIATTPVIGDTWSSINLAEGRYWLTAANGWDVVIRSCEPDGVVKAVTPGDAPTSG